MEEGVEARMMGKSKKGFIGPIGDDLPSLIPLVFALMIFFSVFTFTWNVFDQKNRVFDDAISIIEVSSILKSNGYIQSKSVFDERCIEAQSKKRMKFRAGLIELSTSEKDRFEWIDIEQPEYFEDPINPGDVFECTNTDSGAEENPSFGDESVVIRFFPVALERDYKDAKDERHFFVKPMLLMVVAWK